MSFDYPKGRPNFYAYKVIRLMTKTRAVDDIGSLGFVLVSIVATTEDATGYKKAVTFWNNPLMQDCGIGSDKTFYRVRDKCVEFGWLEYEGTGTRKPNRYFSKIPDDLLDFQDKSTDESLTVNFTGNSTPNTPSNATVIGVVKGSESGGQSSGNPTPPSSLTLDLDPKPNPSPKKPPKSPKGGLDNLAIKFWENHKDYAREEDDRGMVLDYFQRRLEGRTVKGERIGPTHRKLTAEEVERAFMAYRSMHEGKGDQRPGIRRFLNSFETISQYLDGDIAKARPKKSLMEEFFPSRFKEEVVKDADVVYGEPPLLPPPNVGEL